MINELYKMVTFAYNPALIHSGVEASDFDNPYLCARCVAKMKKDY